MISIRSRLLGFAGLLVFVGASASASTSSLGNEEALIELKAFIGKSVGKDASGKAPRSTLDRILEAGSSPICQASYAVVKMVSTKEWKVNDGQAALLKSYARKYLKDPSSVDHAGAFRHLAEGIRTAGESWWAARALALAHMESATGVEAGRYQDDLSLKGGSGIWSTKEGLAIDEARSSLGSIDSLDGAFSRGNPSAPVWSVFRGIAATDACLSAGGSPESINFALANLGKVKYPSSKIKSTLSKVKSVLKKAKPCKWCGGSNIVPCGFSACKNGTVIKRCGTCQGTGLAPNVRGLNKLEMEGARRQKGSSYECPAKVPGRGGVTGHIWEDKCTMCKGSAKVKCRSCKKPYSAPSLSLLNKDDCELCSGSGLILGNAKLPCVDCYGFGEKVAYKK